MRIYLKRTDYCHQRAEAKPDKSIDKETQWENQNGKLGNGNIKKDYAKIE